MEGKTEGEDPGETGQCGVPGELLCGNSGGSKVNTESITSLLFILIHFIFKNRTI